MTRTSSAPHVLGRAALCVALLAPLGACKDDTKDTPADGEAKSGEPKSDDGTKAGGKEAADGGEKSGGLADKLAGGLVGDLAPADQIQRGDALGHFLVANPNGLLEEVAKQGAPAKFAPTVNEAALKALAGMALGDKAALVQHLDFGKPFGCMVLSSTVTDVPVACTMGYQGGAAALATDLGGEGKAADAGGHAAHYVLEGQDMFVDELGGQVVVSNHTEIFGKAKGYLEANMIGRASKLATDIEIVGFLGAAAKRYESQVDTLMSEMSRASSTRTGNKFTDAMMDYNQQSTTDMFDRLTEIEQITVGIGFEPVGFVSRFATFPVEGSKLQEQAKAAAAGPMQRTTLEALPSSAFLVAGMNADWKAAWDTEQFVKMRDFMLESYAEATGHDATAVKAAVATYVGETHEIYGNEWGFAFAHEPGTVGGMVISQSLKKPGRDHWRTMAKLLTPEMVLGTLGTDWVTWRFEEKVSEVEGVEIDRLTIEPGPELAKKIAEEVAKDSDLAAIETRVGGFKLVMDRGETADRAFYVFAPKAEGQYMKSLMTAAAGSSGTLAGNAGVKLIFDRNPKVSSVMAMDGKATIGWLKELLPPEKAGQIPADLGNDMGDFFFVTSYGSGGSQTGEMVVGQPLIDQIRKLAE